MRTLQLYGAGSATATSVASVTIPASARIVGVQVNLLLDSAVDNAIVRCELSKVPTNQIAVNGAIDPFLEVGLESNFTTSGLAQTSVANFYPVDVACRQGELVYLHVSVTGTLAYSFNAILHYQ